jgi:hypothetical protein
VSAATQQVVLQGDTLRAYIAAKAVALDLDPFAVLAVVEHEGGFSRGAPGDQGTSFGPFQLHRGGALPARVGDPQTWAWTPAGLDYALDRIAKVARGLQGTQAVSAIVTRFERPANPSTQVARSSETYARLLEEASKRRSGLNPFGLPGAVGGAVGDAAGAVSGAVTGVGDAASALGSFFSFVASFRFVELVGGAAVAGVGLVLLGRQFGVDPVGAGAKVAVTAATRGAL